jgi:hypothetical protein
MLLYSVWAGGIRLIFTGEIQEVARFTRGQSGNPAGKPRGARDKRTALRALLVPHAESLTAKTVELAKAGDTTALRLCLDRLIPPVRAKDEPVELGSVGKNLTDYGWHILEASLSGRITPTEAATLMQALSAQARIVEAEELAARLEALEQKVGQVR